MGSICWDCLQMVDILLDDCSLNNMLEYEASSLKKFKKKKKIHLPLTPPNFFSNNLTQTL
jgi:hypothetical protein